MHVHSLACLQSNTLWTKVLKISDCSRKSEIKGGKYSNIVLIDSYVQGFCFLGKTAEQLVNVAAESYMDDIHALFLFATPI